MEYNVEVPIYVQVVRDIKKRIVRKQLLPGEKLPSNRELAVLYKVNPNTAARIDLTVLKDISLKIEDGDIYGLVGRSGAGKSTLLRCINGLTGYQGGSLKVDGCEVKELSGLRLREFRKNIGMIFQQFSLLERKTVYDNVALPMECWGWSKQKRDQKVKELLKLVGLKEKMYVKPRTLSGGQKQRVAIARALTMDRSGRCLKRNVVCCGRA